MIMYLKIFIITFIYNVIYTLNGSHLL